MALFDKIKDFVKPFVESTSLDQPKAQTNTASVFKPAAKTTAVDAVSSAAPKASVFKPAAKTTQPTLSSMSIQNDRQKGVDWSSAGPAQQEYNSTYYKTLDDPTHTKMFRDLQSYSYRTAGGADVDKTAAFRKSYKEGTSYLDNELEDYAQRYGKDSYEYKALQQFKGDYESLGRQVETKTARDNASVYSSQLDQNIQEIYGGLMARPDFQEKVEEGLKDIQRSSSELRNFERMTENASDLQKNLLLYIRATEGNKGVQQFMASGLGELLTATRAADIYSRTIENDSEAFRKAAIGTERFLGNVGNAIPGTIELAKGITGSDKDDPDDKNLGGGYTISDSTDHYLQTSLANDFEQAGVTNEQFKYLAELGGSGLKTEAGSADWYKDFEKNASDYQKQVISFLYASSGEEAAKAMWEGIKDREQQVWGAVKKNSNRLATSVDEDLGALYQQYAHDFGHAAPGFLASVGGEGVTWEELLLQATQSAAEQVIPMLMGNLVGSTFRAAGATKKATNWASRIASATPMATMIGGRGYGEALDKGVSRGKAMGYGITEASLEFITGMLLDGAAGVGGKLTGGIRDKAVAKIASPVLRALADAGIRSWGEGTEEYVQEALEPIIASVFLDEGELVDALGETFDPRNILDPDRLYAGFLGALTAFGMAPGNVAMDIHNNNYYKALGKGFNTINATVKAADVIINNPVEGPDSDSELYEDSKKTAEIIKNGGKVSDLAAGKMIVDYGSAGGDMSAITGLDTMTYNKDSIGYDDYVAGIRSVLVDMNEDVALAEDLAKLATGQTITEEAQTRINESKAAQEILSQLQGDLDMSDNTSALTRAARSTTFRGAMNKIYQTLKNENPDKTVVSPATQQLLNTGLDVNAAQKIGAVIDKVLNGEAITEAEAALVKASSPAIRATVLNTLDIELSEYANKQAVMQALNDFAAEAAKVKEQQAAVRQGAQPAAQARGAAMQGGLTNGIQGNDTGAAGQGENRSVQERPQNSGAATGSPSAVGQAPADLGRSGQRSGRNQRNAGQVHAEVTEERKQDVKRGCVESGADTVKFVVDEDSCTFYDPDDGYVIKIKTNGQFTIEQYGQHEPVHLWITYALSEDHRKEVLDDFSQQFTERFGEDFHDKLYNFIEKVYGEKGYLPEDEDAAMYQIYEDMLSFCYAGQNYGMDLTACRQFARQFVEDHGLKAIGTGDMSNPKVQEALANGWVNPEYYERHGWSQEDDGTSLDISTEEAPTEEPGAAERKKITDYLRRGDLEKMRKNLAKQRKLLVENARKNGDNKPGSPNYEAHRARVAELEAQIKDVESQLAELNAQHSADYEEETNEAVNTRGVQSSAPGEKTGVSQAKQKSDSVQKPKKDLRRKSPEQLQESRDLHEEEVNNLIDEDHEIVPYEQVPEEYRWITDSFAEAAPESEVTYYRDSSEDAPNMYYLPAIVKGADGGFFVNLAKLEEGEWRDDGWTLDNMVLHEKAHFWLDKAGGLAETAWRKLRGKFFVNPNQFGKFADILKAYREWCSDFYHDAEEELVCDVLGGRSIAWDWYAPELWPEARQVMQNFFSANTEYALSKEAETVDEKKSYSADYDPEYYQSIGLIDPAGQTAAFTDNIGGVHEEIINQLNGNPGEDIKDFIARGGIRVKPGSGIEVNGDIAPTAAQYDMIDKIVENFTGKVFGIDFNIDGVSAGTHTFEGADLDPNRVYSYLRNYYERRKADKVRDEKLDKFSETLGMRVSSMLDAYNLAKMVAQMEGMTPELQEIIDTFEQQRFSADYANPESEDYLGPDIDSYTQERALDEDIHRNLDDWGNDETDAETTLDEDLFDAREAALLAELALEGITEERKAELYAEYQQLQESQINYTKHAPKQEEEAKPAPKKSPAAKAFRPKAEVEQKKEPVKVTPKAKPAPESELQQLQREFEAAKATSGDDVDPDLLARVSAALERANIQYAEDMEREAQVAQKAEAAAQAVAEAKKPKTVKVKAKVKPVVPAAQTEEAKAKPEVIVFKNDGTKFTKIPKSDRKSKNPKYVQNIGNAKNIEIRRRRSDRNTFDVRFNDGKGNIVAYEEISPAALIKAFAFATGDRDTAKARAGEAMAMASEPSLAWSLVPNPKVVKATEAKPEEVRASDNYGRSVPVKLTKYLENSAIRTEDGALINTYRLAPANGVHNAKMPGKVSMYTERPAPINTMRGMKGAEAFGQSGKGVAEQLSEWLDALTNPEITPKRAEEIRLQIVETEQQMRKYTNGVTRLDPNRPGYEFATPENVVNGKSLVETYLDIRKPKVIDAKGKGVDFIQQEVQKFIRDPANKAGLFDAQKNPIGPNDGFKFLNARIIPEGETLGGGEADLDTVYVTLRNNQAKSTYNTAPTDSDLIQYSADYDNAMIEEEDMRDRGILERKGEGFSDAHGNWISPEQANHFEMAKMIDQNGNLVYGITPLFHGGRTIYFRFDPSKSTYPWFYLTTNPRVAKGYDDGGPKEIVDLKLREKLFRRLAKAMNLGNPSAALKAFKEQILGGPEEQQNQTAQKYTDIINSYLRDGGKLYDKYDDKYVEDISSINAIPVNKQDFEQRLEDSMATLDDQLLLLGDAMGDLEDKMDAYKGKPERKQMDEYHALLDDLYYYAQSVLDSAKDGTAVSDDFNAWPLVLALPITDSETGEILVDTHALADGIIGSIRSSADTVKDRVEDLNDLQPSFEVRYKDGGYEQLMFEELPSLATKGGATAFYANITNPLVVDGTTRDGKTGHWTALDITGIPEMLKLFPDGKAETDDVADWARDHGYDGVIIRNIYDTATGDDRPGFEGDDYIVFDSSKVKSVNNRTPTSGPLFNYSADYADIDTGYTEGTLEDTIIKILRDKDIDRASAALAEYMANFLQTGVLPQMENERTQNIFQPRIGESQRKLLEEQLRKDIEKYGEIEPGEKPAREIHFPKQTEQGVVRRTLRTVAESKNVPDRMIPAVMRDIVQGRGDDRTVVYQRMTDKAAVAYADREMRKKGYDAARAEWQGRRDQDSKVTKNDIALGELVMIEAAKAGDVDTALTTAAELAEAATNAGQVVQAIRLIKSMPASYQLYYFQRVANRLNRQYSKRIKSGKMDELKVDRDLAKAVINAKTDEDLETAINNLIQSLADQIPATMADKWNAWRYLAMLGNPKTHIRNILGNGIFVPAKFAKDLIRAGLEGVIVKDPNQRTSSLRGLIGAPSAYRNFAEKDYEGIKKDLQAGGKYNPTNDIMQKRTVFGNKFVEWLRQKNGDLLEAEDGKFLKFHYVNALTNFLATRGVSIEALESTPDGAKVLNAARQYAFSEALKATYRDASSIASALNMIKRTNPTAGILLDGLVPFTKTPINILKRGIEYSPIGLLGSVTRGLAQLKNGDIDANQFCDNLAAGLTGTGIAILGFWLTSLGVLKGGDDDDDKKADFDKLMGYQNYSINIGDQNFTIDWAAPSALPLFVGSALFTELAESNGLTFADIFNAATVIAEPLTQLSMLSGINDALKSAKWDENPLSSVVSSMATGYVSQGVPTFVAQIARTGAENRRTTYVDKNSDIPPAIQRWAQTNVLGKIPGLNNKRAEYIDAWGRKDTEKNALVRLFDNMFAPWYRNEINITQVDKELMRLSEETGTSVLMSPADRYIEFDNQKHDLTAQQYETYAKVRGQRTFEMLGELFNSVAYQKGMTETEKAKAVEFIKQYGNILGKQAVFPEYETDNDNWAEKCDGDTTRLLDMAMAKAQANALDITAGNNGEFYQMVMNTDWMSPVEQGYIIAQQYNTTSETVYVRKGGPKYELTNDRKDQLYEYYRLIFPEYYLQLVGTTAWQNANDEQRLEMLSKVRSDVGGIAKAWLAERLQEAGAPVYTGK